MILYVCLIALGLLVACTLGLNFGVPFLGATGLDVALAVGLTFLALFIVDAVCALTIRVLPKKLVNPLHKIYHVAGWEKKLHLKLCVKVWKDIIPENGGSLAGFSKREVADKSNNDYIFLFMQETVIAELMHWLSAIFSLLVIFIYTDIFVVVGLPLMIVNIIMNILPVIVQRYNRPKLMALYKRNLAKQKKI